MIAIKRLQSILWILFVALGALSVYLVSLRVATERNAVHAVERSISATHDNIRYLEVEFRARATMKQLEAWNIQAIRYSVPKAGQFLTSERELAMLGRTETPAPAMMTPPVLAPDAMPETVRASADAPAASQPAMAIPVKVSAPAPAARPALAVAVAAPAARPATVKLIDKADPSQRRAMRLALLDQTLGGVAGSGGDAAPSAKAAR